ncbi:MAG: B12-binding domain-containing radical SAM protein [Chloroflexi bacterium]|nr:B12-binding domain-containing radical SAM protein [Chloroflexota bacterium]MCI0579631.1 B12-binding domain-containing radical SAM protein [Chloroflexota bacterium]MCI0643564.1 B12-binding domain-containing radical SAM protein [Chloroflexota bacterium]MCI0726186.1 B12-binding domain-containing radical SAM protein [Chloroflexota bacterium]
MSVNGPTIAMSDLSVRSAPLSPERTDVNRKIFLINYRNHRDMYPPFGIMYVADALEQVGFEVRLFHDTADKVDDFIRLVAEERPLFVGFSTITGPQLQPVIDASRHVRALGIPVVWGGVHATIMPLEVLKEEYVDFVVVNEGEETAQDFALKLATEEKPEWSTVAGLAYKLPDGTPMFHMERPFIQELDQYRPRWDLLTDVEAYLIPSGPYQRAMPVYISRGCPFRCGFCYNEVVMKRTWRQHSDEFILNQINWLKENYQIDAVDYADDYLFGRIKPMQRLVEKVGMPWSGQVRVQLLKPEFVQWMYDTGCQWVNIGAESGSQAVLDSMWKDQKDWQIEWGIRHLVEFAPNVEANLSFIIGLPGETDADTKITFDLIERLCDLSDKIRCSVCVYMPYPGTPLWPKALEQGYVPPPNQEGWCGFDLNRGNTPWMDDAEAQVMSEVNDILFVGRSQGHWLLAPYYRLLRWRWRHRYFKHYWEGALKRAAINSPLRPLLAWLTRRLVKFNPITHKGTISEGAELLGLEA